MKRSNKLLILVGVLIVCCLATLAVVKHEEHKEKIKNSDEIVLEIPADSVKTLSWKNETNTLSFHKDNDQWIYDGDDAFPVDEEKIHDMLSIFEQFGVSFIIEDVEDYGQYGLDNPVCTINLSTDDKSYEIKLGDFSTMDRQRYVSIGDGKVYLVKNDPLDYYDAVLKDVVDSDEPPAFDKVSKIQFAGTENYSVIYQENNAYAYGEDDVYYAQKDGSNLPVDAKRVKSYLNTISSLDLSNYVSYHATDDELKTYGLDAPELTVMVDYTSKDDKGKETPGTFVLNISRDPEEKKAAEKAAEEKTDENDKKEGDNSEEEEEITAYARVGESQLVYQISPDSYKSLMKASYDSLRHPEVLPAAFDEVNKIEVSLEGNSYIFTSEKKGDKRTWYYQGEELDMENFQSTIESFTADSFTDEKPTKKKEIGLTLYLDNQNYPQIQIELYRYDGKHCLAVIDGKPVSLVKRSVTVDLMEAVYSIILG